MKHLIIILAMLTMTASGQSKAIKISDAALERTNHYVTYNGAWVKLDYPNGDVADHYGVCTDVVIRTYRNALGVDFQKLIHEDMVSNFSAYPKRRNKTKTDRNIDHRRTENQECFLKRHGAALSVTDNPDDYLPGDLVYYGDIAAGHVGVVVDRKYDGVPMIVHNIGGGPQLDDFLFSSKITGHYRYLP
jgi:hypothetical protein